MGIMPENEMLKSIVFKSSFIKLGSTSPLKRITLQPGGENQKALILVFEALVEHAKLHISTGF